MVQIAAIGLASVAPPLGTQHDKRQAARIRGLRSRGLFVAPRIGAAIDVGLRADMVCSMHPHGISRDERTCLYFQDTWHVQEERGRWWPPAG